jgi:hypothetical protein
MQQISTASASWRFTRNKYNAVPTEVDGFRFDSKMEADYYKYLLLLQRAGDILHIDVHPSATVGLGDRHTLDFLVWYPDGRVEFIDVKGARKSRAASEFRRLQRRWRHPAAALRAVTKKGAGWIDWE